MAIYSGFSHWKWWFSIATLNYQRVRKLTSTVWATQKIWLSTIKSVQNLVHGSPWSVFLTGADRMEWGKGGKGTITSAHPLGDVPYLAPARFLGQSPSRARGLNAASGHHPPNCVFHVTDLVSKSHQSTNLMTSAYCKHFSSPYCLTWPWVKACQNLRYHFVDDFPPLQPRANAKQRNISRFRHGSCSAWQGWHRSIIPANSRIPQFNSTLHRAELLLLLAEAFDAWRRNPQHHLLGPRWARSRSQSQHPFLLRWELLRWELVWVQLLALVLAQVLVELVPGLWTKLWLWLWWWWWMWLWLWLWMWLWLWTKLWLVGAPPWHFPSLHPR